MRKNSGMKTGQNDLKGQIESLCNSTADFKTRLFNTMLEEIRIEFQKVNEERNRVVTSYLVRNMMPKKALDMLESLEENERLENKEAFAEGESIVNKIIVIDNDLSEESINVCLYNDETYKSELNNKKKRKSKHMFCYKEKYE